MAYLRLLIFSENEFPTSMKKNKERYKSMNCLVQKNPSRTKISEMLFNRKNKLNCYNIMLDTKNCTEETTL